MMNYVDSLKSVFADALKSAEDLSTLDELRLAYMGKKGLVKNLFENLKSTSSEIRGAKAKELNEFKEYVEAELMRAESDLKHRENNLRIQDEWQDISLPSSIQQQGSLHPLTRIERHCIEVLGMMGFKLAEGPEIEDAFHNFDALNISENHPARDMQDTFWLEKELLLRSHTSTIQIRTLQEQKDLPIRIISPGRVYRNESVDATHLAYFHQFEGLWVDEGVKFSHLKGTVDFIIKNTFGDGWDIRYKPKFYPYTEPSVGVDVREKGKNGKWITVLRAGMVHPNVFRMTGHDPKKVSGFAFGLGTSRMVSMAHGVTDMKSLYLGDLRVHQRLARKAYKA